MASLVNCPHCGTRPREEFSIRGAALARPAPDAPAKEWQAYVYERDNPTGEHREYWHHLSGCRRGLIVTRDTVTHQTYHVEAVS